MKVSFKKQLAAIQIQLKQLKIRLGLNEIDKETYEMTMEHLGCEQVQKINKEMNSGNVTISNLNLYSLQWK
jgi:site-specific DNA recombinase